MDIHYLVHTTYTVQLSYVPLLPPMLEWGRTEEEQCVILLLSSFPSLLLFFFSVSISQTPVLVSLEISIRKFISFHEVPSGGIEPANLLGKKNK